MKKTLLEITQEILTSMDGDEVNSISDTTESLAVANIIQNTYWDIVSQASFPKMFSPFELEASGNINYPNIMYLPETALSCAWIRYDESTTDNIEAGYRPLIPVDLQTFIQRMYSLDATDTGVDSFDYTMDNGDTINIRCQNTAPPSCYATLDDRTIVFDSYDADVDATLQADKSLAYGERKPTFTLTDSFIPDLPDRQFTILRNEAKAQAFADLKQMTNTKAEQRARRGWITSQKTKQKIDNPRRQIDRTPNFAR